MSEGTNMSKAEIEALVERLVSERVARIEIDFEHKLKFLENSFTERHEKLKQRVKKIREIIYEDILINSEDVNDTCLESRISSLEEGEELAEFIKVDQENDKELEERLRSMDNRFDHLTFKLEISDSGGRIDTLESELADLEELVKGLQR
jgi:polyhydroxyalkanoate synthesis regulator phasin